jgi:tetratricopeptide (TPR) repeat protein
VDDALAEIRKAQTLDPLSAVITADLGKDLYLARRYDEAIVELRRALELDSNFIAAHNWISDTYLEKGMYPEAISELGKRNRTKKKGSMYGKRPTFMHGWADERRQSEHWQNHCSSPKESR